MADRGLNPLTWKRRHLVTWAVLTLLGAAGGVLFGWAISPFAHSGDPGTLFIAWLHYPIAYWPYAAAGAVTVALAYYAADLLTGAR
jgi:hypothetical protein